MSFEFSFRYLLIIALGYSFYSCNPNNETITENLDNPVKSKSEIILKDSTTSLKETHKLDTLSIEFQTKQASKHYADKKLDKAIFHFLKVLEMDNENLFALINLGNIHYDIGQHKKAIEFYQRSLDLDNENINVRCDMATCYLNDKMPEKAIEILKENTEINFNHPPTHHNLAVIYKQMGKNKEAEEEYRIWEQLKNLRK